MTPAARPAAAAVTASGLLTRPGVPALLRAALAASFGAALPAAGRHGANAAPASQPDTTPDTSPDAAADTSPDAPSDSRPDTVKRSSRPAGRAGTAVAVARLHGRYPHLTAASIGERLGISERTVRRHLAARTALRGPAA